jgi:hypothetical protein
MGGGGSKGGSSSSDTAATKALADISKQVWNESKPGFQELMSQGMEAWKTGGTSASIPMVQRAVESSKVAGSEAMKQAESGLASSGLSGTPYGESILAQTGLSSELAANNAGMDIGKYIMSMLPGLVTGGQSNAFSGLSNTANAQAAIKNANTAAATSKGNSMMSFLSAGLFG